MGTYSQPSIIQNSRGLANMTAGTTKFNESLKTQFDDIAKRELERAKLNANNLSKIQKDRNKLDAKWDKIVTKANIDDEPIVEEALNQMHDKYIEITNKPVKTKEDKKMLRWLENQPDQIANSLSLQNKHKQELIEIQKKEDFSAGSLNNMYQNSSILSLTADNIINNGQNTKLVVDFDNLSLDYKTIDQDVYEESYSQAEQEAKQKHKDKASKVTVGPTVAWDNLPDEVKEDLIKKEMVDESAYTSNLNIKSYVEMSTRDDAPPVFRTNGNIKEIAEETTGDEVKKIVEDLSRNYPTKTQNQKLTKAQNDQNMNDFNDGLANKLLSMDVSAVYNNGGLCQDLWPGALDRSLSELITLQSAFETGDLTEEEMNPMQKNLFKVWYGENWSDNLKDLTVDDDDMIKKAREEGVAVFGLWQGTNSAPDNEMANWQRSVIEQDVKSQDYKMNVMTEAPNYITPPKTTSGGSKKTNKIAAIDKFSKHYFDENGLKQGINAIDVTTQANKFVKDKADGMYVTAGQLKNNDDYMSQDAIKEFLDKTDDNTVIWLDKDKRFTVPPIDNMKVESMFTIIGLDNFATQEAKLSNNIKYK